MYIHAVLKRLEIIVFLESRLDVIHFVNFFELDTKLIGELPFSSSGNS
jgi:hypothetical protein